MNIFTASTSTNRPPGVVVLWAAISCLALLVLSPASLLAKETGFKSPSNKDDDYNQWTDPARAYASDTEFARENRNGDAQDWYDFHFQIPAGATIKGIQINVEGNNQGEANGVDIDLSWDGGTSYTSSGKGAIWPISMVDSIEIFGGPADGWGRTWSPSEFENGNFRIRLTRKGAVDSHDFHVNHIEANVSYDSDTYVTQSVQDSYLKEASPTTNFGLNAELLTKTKPTDDLRAVMQFDLSSIPGSESVTGATLQLWVTKEAPSSVSIHRITAPWTEMGVDWSNTAANYDP
ncbi:MAG: DNRLRE domain-containing protein, partial [Candidatus Eisenbacteria bacterium]|nr:DNRLRE domain-containing protein [Candidatus Eisenbacteria bacterium]